MKKKISLVGIIYLTTYIPGVARWIYREDPKRYRKEVRGGLYAIIGHLTKNENMIKLGKKEIIESRKGEQTK